MFDSNRYLAYKQENPFSLIIINVAGIYRTFGNDAVLLGAIYNQSVVFTLTDNGQKIMMFSISESQVFEVIQRLTGLSVNILVID